MEFRKTNWLTNARPVILYGLWFMAIGGALVFMAIKVRNWGPAVDAPEQSDFVSYYYAAQISEKSPQLLYRSTEWNKVLGPNLPTPLPFLYLPAVAVSLRPLSHLSLNVARRLWFWASLLSIGGTILLLSSRVPSSKIRLIGFGLLILSPSTLDTLHLGQINGFLAVLVALACLGIDASRRWVSFFSGCLLGIAVCIKPIPIGLALLALIHRRFTFLAGFGFGVVLFFMIGVIALPLEVTQHYFELVRTMSGELAPPGLTIFWNQSVPAFWQKLLGDSNSGWVKLLSLLSVSGLAIFVFWLLRKKFRQALGKIWIETALVFLTLLLCSPITWWHYPLIVAPVYIGVTEAYLAHGPAGWRLALPLGYGLIVAQRATERLAPLIGLSLLSSLMMFGLLLWLLMLAKLPAGQARSLIGDNSFYEAQPAAANLTGLASVKG